MEQKRGFTLIELSIVLVIIGLIVGGVLVGQDLIRAAEIRSFISEHQKATTAITTFRLKYNAMPGDMKNAYNFFGSDCGANSTNAYNGCNGVGGGCVNNNAAECNISIYHLQADSRRFFVHMALSGLMPNVPYVTNSATQTDCSRGVTFPEAPLKSTYLPVSSTPKKVNFFYHAWSSTHSANACGINYSAQSFLLTPEETMRIDQKMDDGLGKSGKMIAPINHFQGLYSANCTNVDGTYNLNYTDPICKFGIQAY